MVCAEPLGNREAAETRQVLGRGSGGGGFGKRWWGGDGIDRIQTLEVRSFIGGRGGDGGGGGQWKHLIGVAGPA